MVSKGQLPSKEYTRHTLTGMRSSSFANPAEMGSQLKSRYLEDSSLDSDQ